MKVEFYVLNGGGENERINKACELVENAIGLVREAELKSVESEAEARVEERLLDLLAPRPGVVEVSSAEPSSADQYERTRGKMREMLRAGELEDRKVEISPSVEAAIAACGLQSVHAAATIEVVGLYGPAV